LRQAIDRYDNPSNALIFEDSFSTRGSRPAATLAGRFRRDADRLAGY
jgi:hypothetical protein